MGNFHSLEAWLTGTVLVLVLIVVGVILVSRSSRGDHRGALTTVACALVGLFVIGIALAGKAPALAGWIVNLFTT